MINICKFLCFVLLFGSAALASASPPNIGMSLVDRIDAALAAPASFADKYVFYSINIADNTVPLVLILLAGTSIFLTIYYRFINITALGLAMRTVQGKYTPANAPGQITHFQALTAALSATVGLGNIAGVAVAVGVGGPGATFWMILMGLCSMTTKFVECTLGVRYREIDAEGRTKGGAMYYLRTGLAEKGLPQLGIILALIFAVFCMTSTFGVSMFQVNQAYTQFSSTFGVLQDSNGSVIFGVIVAIITGLVIIGGIESIAGVTEKLVPFMCVSYVVAAAVIIVMNIDRVGDAFGQIIGGAFSPVAVGGGAIGVLIQGVKRASFSNEAGIGSAAIAHSAVKTEKPASEGLVALLEPFTDTVIVCTMTALVLTLSGSWKIDGIAMQDDVALRAAPAMTAEVVKSVDKGEELRFIGKENGFSKVYLSENQTAWVDNTLIEPVAGITKTSIAFEQAISWFPKMLAIAVLLFAFSTMISWSYYGEQAIVYLTGGYNKSVVLGFKVALLLCVVVGASASVGNVVMMADALIFAMAVPNIIGIYILLPVVTRELKSYIQYTKDKDALNGK